MTRLRVAVIGVGALGRHHARILSQLPDVELVGVADPNSESGRTVAESAGTKWFSDHRSLLDAVEAVTIAVPTCFHLRVAADFLQCGIPTLVEKPLAADLCEAVQLVKLAEQSGATLQVGHVERFNPAFQTAARLCDQPKYIRCERLSPFSFRSTDIGVVHDLMIHDLDLVLSLVGSPVARVEAFGFALMGDHEDAVQARLTFENGCVADLSASRLHPTARRDATIWTTGSCLSIDFASREVTAYAPSPRLLFGMSPVETARQPGADLARLRQDVFGSMIEVRKAPVPTQDPLTMELQEFLACVRSGSTPTVTGAIALEALQVADRVLQSVAAQRTSRGKIHLVPPNLSDVIIPQAA